MDGQIIGYARVSSLEQNLDRQIEALGNCDRIFTEKVSGGTRERPELTTMLAYARSGDTVRVSSMDRLARSTRDLLDIVDELKSNGVTVEILDKRLTFSPDSDDPYVNFQFQLLGAVAELERSMIRERQAEGIKLAKARGAYKGRAKKLDPKRRAEAVSLVREKGLPVRRVAMMLEISRDTLYSYLREHDEREAEKAQQSA